MTLGAAMDSSEAAAGSAAGGWAGVAGSAGAEAPQPARSNASKMAVSAIPFLFPTFFTWLSTEEARDIKNGEEKFTHLKEELADVIIYCLSLANQLDIDVASAIEDKIEKNARKYPMERSKMESIKISRSQR